MSKPRNKAAELCGNIVSPFLHGLIQRSVSIHDPALYHELDHYHEHIYYSRFPLLNKVLSELCRYISRLVSIHTGTLPLDTGKWGLYRSRYKSCHPFLGLHKLFNSNSRPFHELCRASRGFCMTIRGLSWETSDLTCFSLFLVGNFLTRKDESVWFFPTLYSFSLSRSGYSHIQRVKMPEIPRPDLLYSSLSRGFSTTVR